MGGSLLILQWSAVPKSPSKRGGGAPGRCVLNVLHLHKHTEAEKSSLPPSQSGSHAKTTCPERQENNTESLTGTVRGEGRAADRRKVVAVRRLAFAPHTCVRLAKYTCKDTFEDAREVSPTKNQIKTRWVREKCQFGNLDN